MGAEVDGFSISSHNTKHEQNKAATNASGGFKASWRPLGNFTRHLLSPDTLQHLDGVHHSVRRVCYGGSFAASGRNVQRIPLDDWSALSTALLRGDNIEEGHFVERLWAALLSPPVNAPRWGGWRASAALISQETSIVTKNQRKCHFKNQRKCQPAVTSGRATALRFLPRACTLKTVLACRPYAPCYKVEEFDGGGLLCFYLSICTLPPAPLSHR